MSRKSAQPEQSGEMAEHAALSGRTSGDWLWIAIRILLALGVGCIAGAFGLYFVQFGLGGSLSQDRGVWGQFGDFVGGTTNPLLAFLTLIGLLLTLNIQKQQIENAERQLGESAREQTAMMKELTRAAEALERAHYALSRHSDTARRIAALTSVNLLLETCRHELNALNPDALVETDPRLSRWRGMKYREERLLAHLDEIYQEYLTGREGEG